MRTNHRGLVGVEGGLGDWLAEERSEIQLKPQALTMKASQNSCLCWHRSP